MASGGQLPDEREMARLKLAQEALLRLSSLVQTLRMYPAGHPRIEAASGLCVEALQRALQETPALLLLAHYEDLLCEDGVMSRTDPVCKALVPELRKRQIRMLLIRKSATPEDILKLARVIAAKPEEIEAQGGALQMLTQSGASSIELLEFKYSMEGDQPGGEIEDPKTAVENVRSLLAYRKAFEQLLQRAGLAPSDATVMHRAITDQSVLEKSLLLDGLVPSSSQRSGKFGPSLTIAENIVKIIKGSGVGAGRVGVPAIGKTFNWVLDSATQTVRASAQGPGTNILDDIAERIFDSPDKLGQFLRTRAEESGDTDQGMADLLKYLFAPPPKRAQAHEEHSEDIQFRSAPRTPEMHIVLKRLAEMAAGQEGAPADFSDEGFALSASDTVWELLRAERDMAYARHLAGRLAETIVSLGAEGKSKLVHRLLTELSHTGDGEEEAIRMLSCRDALQPLEPAEVLDLILSNGAEPQETQSLLSGLIKWKPEALSLLIDRFFLAKDEKEATALAQAVGMLGAAAIPILRELIKDRDPAHLRGLARLLPFLKDESAVGFLELLSDHRDAHLVRAALTALAEIGSSDAAQIIGKKCSAGDGETRRAAILLLAGVRQPAAIETLRNIAQMRDLLGRRLDERLLAVEALGRMRVLEVEPYLRRLASVRGIFRRKTAARLRYAASRALARLEEAPTTREQQTDHTSRMKP